jgi:phosphomevalonate kinase
MKACAPGKLVLTGAYAVLDGAPAVVAAVDRLAVADASRPASPVMIEVRAALGDKPAPHLDLRALQDADGRKLGLGSSAAGVVASLAVRALEGGACLADEGLRSGLFDQARRAHAQAQSGGSGVDVAASVFGGALCYRLAADGPVIRPVTLPRGLVLAAFFSRVSARTSELRARVDAARSRDPRGWLELSNAMAEGAIEAALRIEEGDLGGFIRSAAAYGGLLARLGLLADAPIVPAPWRALAAAALAENAAFLPSGAGGGDVAIWLGGLPPSPAFAARASAVGLASHRLSVDFGGVRSFPDPASPDPAS